jgi:hypothetical protein
MRLPEAEEAGIYRAADLFVDQILAGEGSLFAPGASVWTAANIDDFYERFVLQPHVSGTSFEEKLHGQLTGASPDVVQLAAELLYIYFLLPMNSGGETKRKQVRTVLSWSSGAASMPDDLATVLDGGIVRTGVAYFTLRYDQLCYFLNLLRAWRQLPPEEQDELLHDPWRFKAFDANLEVGSAKAMRETLRHLIFPDSFEPIVSLDHKEEFADFFSALAPDVTDLDQKLLAIHRALAETHGAFATFYDPMIQALMETPGGPHDYAVWWVNQGQTYAQERDGGYLWAPKANEKGQTMEAWTNMELLKVGDVIVHYAKGIRALSRVTQEWETASRPSELQRHPWEDEGYRVLARYEELAAPISLEDLPPDVRRPSQGPFDVNGDVKQRYLLAVPADMAAALKRLLAASWPGGDGATGTKVRNDNGGGGKPMEPHPIYASIAEKGFSFPDWLVTDYLLALGTKPFVLLSGISGTGKTKLAQLVAEHLAPPVKVLEPEGEAPIPDAGSFVHTVGTGTLDHGAVAVPLRYSSLFPELPSTGSVECRLEAPGLSSTARFYSEGSWAKGSNASIRMRRDAQRWLSSVAKKGDYLLVTPKNDGEFVVRFDVVPAGRREVPATSSRVAFISVRADWTDNRSMLGYFNPLTEQYVPTELLRLLLHAAAHPDEPHFAILDEMNLAKVEYYFSDFLSAMESGTEILLHDAGEAVTAEIGGEELPIPERLRVPANLLFTGTVNVDETTFMFSPKVLDRANVIQFHTVNLSAYGREGKITADTDGLVLPATAKLEQLLRPSPARRDDYLALDAVSRTCLETVNELLASHHLHFGYRVANEIARYLRLTRVQLGASQVPRALDLQIQQKILPKFVGNRAKLEQPLWELLTYLRTGELESRPLTAAALAEAQSTQARYPGSVSALAHMLQTLRQVGFASFIE